VEKLRWNWPVSPLPPFLFALLVCFRQGCVVRSRGGVAVALRHPVMGATRLQPALALQKADRFPRYYVRSSELRNDLRAR
jgi:hypothetical protein